MKRYYFHGDRTEHDANLYYCAFCDLFQPLDHHMQDSHPKVRLSDYEKFKRMEKGGFSKNFYRPSDAYNIHS